MSFEKIFFLLVSYDFDKLCVCTKLHREMPEQHTHMQLTRIYINFNKCSIIRLLFLVKTWNNKPLNSIFVALFFFLVETKIEKVADISGQLSLTIIIK